MRNRIGIILLIVILTGCRGMVRDEQVTRRYKGRIYLTAEERKYKAQFDAVLESEEFYMKFFTTFGETVGYVTGSRGDLDVRDGDGREYEAGKYIKLFNILLDILKNNAFNAKIEENGITLEFLRRDDSGFPYIWRIREGLYEVKVVFNEYDGKRIR